MGIKSRLCSLCFPQTLASAGIRRLAANGGIVLMYHEVLPDSCSLPAWTVVRESDFRWQMEYLHQHFDVLSMAAAVERLAEGRRSRRPFAVITFDDGYRGNLKTVLPIMESMGLPFVVYVATRALVEQNIYWHDKVINLLGSGKEERIEIHLQNGRQRRFLLPSDRATENRRWTAMQQLLHFLKQLDPAVRELAVGRITKAVDQEKSALIMLRAEGLQRLAASDCVTIGSHTHGHELLVQLRPEQIAATVKTADGLLAGITGEPPAHFAYPNGDYNELVVEQIKKAGYSTAVTTTGGIWSAQHSLFKIPRIGIGRFDTRGRFKALVSGYLH
ncbi:MAG: polysaccharide deacetylase family protein [Desulfobulbus sp.]|nr:polysaccharide deacetylase family protein [Desulfobulbus sp.]